MAYDLSPAALGNRDFYLENWRINDLLRPGVVCCREPLWLDGRRIQLAKTRC